MAFVNGMVVLLATQCCRFINTAKEKERKHMMMECRGDAGQYQHAGHTWAGFFESPGSSSILAPATSM